MLAQPTGFSWLQYASRGCTAVLISGSNDYMEHRMINVWSTNTWACERTLEGHTKTVFSLVMHGDKLISGSADRTIKVWGR
jgi:WD40 repeat protein